MSGWARAIHQKRRLVTSPGALFKVGGAYARKRIHARPCFPRRQFLHRSRNSFQSPGPALTILTALILFVAGFLSGMVNAIAGGGTFLTFGALSLAGIPPIVANATSSITQFPGYVTSTLEAAPVGAGGLPRRLYAATPLGRRMLAVWTSGATQLLPEFGR